MMNNCFEDEFMDIQAGLVSLAKEVVRAVNARVDRIFVHVGCTDIMAAVNVFFEQDGAIKTMREIGCGYKLMHDFMMIGLEDVRKLRKTGQKYDRPIPIEMKLYYNANTRGFEAEYRYDTGHSAKEEKAAGEQFVDWMAQEKQKLAAN